MNVWPNLFPTLSKALPSPALRVLSFGGVAFSLGSQKDVTAWNSRALRTIPHGIDGLHNDS